MSALGELVRLFRREQAIGNGQTDAQILSDVRQRVLADMMINLGKERFEKFQKMIANVKEGKFPEAADEMKASKWYEQVKTRGKTLRL